MATILLPRMARLQAVTITAAFPSNLNPGQEITGTINVTNNDTAAHAITVKVTPAWAPDKALTSLTLVIEAGASQTFNFPADFEPETNKPLLMPKQDAVLTIDALEGTTVLASTKVTISAPWYYKQIYGIPLWMLLAGAAVIVGIAVIATRPKK